MAAAETASAVPVGRKTLSDELLLVLVITVENEETGWVVAGGKGSEEDSLMDGEGAADEGEGR